MKVRPWRWLFAMPWAPPQPFLQNSWQAQASGTFICFMWEQDGRAPGFRGYVGG